MAAGRGMAGNGKPVCPVLAQRERKDRRFMRLLSWFASQHLLPRGEAQLRDARSGERCAGLNIMRAGSYESRQALSENDKSREGGKRQVRQAMYCWTTGLKLS